MHCGLFFILSASYFLLSSLGSIFNSIVCCCVVRFRCFFLFQKELLNRINRNSDDDNNDLFGTHEIIEIMTDFIGSARPCKKYNYRRQYSYSIHHNGYGYVSTPHDIKSNYSYQKSQLRNRQTKIIRRKRGKIEVSLFNNREEKQFKPQLAVLLLFNGLFLLLVR